MALDYSKLTDAELDAIANDDYSKLSDSTLQMLANEPSSSSAKSSMTTTEPSLAGPIQQQAALTAVKPALGIAASQAGDAFKLARIAGEMTPSVVGEFLSTPITSAKNLASAYVAGHPMASTVGNMPFKQMPGALARTAATAALAPENILLAPYTMAAYEQEKIRANPNAPEYAKNPYAMSVRSENTPTPITQGQAGAMNRRNVVANMPYGNVTPEERAMLDQDRIRKEQNQLRARQVLQQPPTAQNYIERMKALSTLYSPVNER